MKMKKLLYIISIIGVFAWLTGCEEDIRTPLFSDAQAPMPVSSPEVTNLAGAAIISYTLPADEDLLYIRAEYTLESGLEVETKSSNFLNQVLVEGFGNTSEKTVTLYAVDRSENESTPVQVKVNPELPNVHLVQNSVEMIPDFGGVQFRWTNENNAALSYLILATDSTGNLSEVETVYSGVTNGLYTVRGFAPEEKEFGIVLRDRWDNSSDTAKITVTPLFEQKLDNSKINKITLDNDHDWGAWEGKYEYAFDNNINTFNHTWAGSGWPQLMTIDLGMEVRLSRVNIVQRQNFPYAHGNPRLLDIYGMLEEPAQDGGFDNWIPMRVAPQNGCVASRPSIEGGTSAEDQEHLISGDEYSFTLDDPNIRYIRLVVNETWGLTGFSHFGEITFYGQVINEN